jgi:hypothetical protein
MLSAGMMFPRKGFLLFRGSLTIASLPLELTLLLKSPLSSRSVGAVRLRMLCGRR